MLGKGASQRGSWILTTSQATSQDDTKTQITWVSDGQGHTFTRTAKMCISLALTLMSLQKPKDRLREFPESLSLLLSIATPNKSPFPASHF